MDKILTYYYRLSFRDRTIIHFFCTTLMVTIAAYAAWYAFTRFAFKQIYLYAPTLFSFIHLDVKTAYRTTEFFGLYAVITMIMFLIGFRFSRERSEGQKQMRRVHERLEEVTLRLHDQYQSVVESERRYRKIADEQRELKDEAYHRQRMFLEVIDACPVFIFAKDIAGKFFIVNRRFSELFNHNPQFLIGKTDRDIYGDEGKLKRIRQQDQEVMARNERMICRETLTDFEGNEIEVRMDKLPFRTFDGKSAVLVVAVDITPYSDLADACLWRLTKMDHCSKLGELKTVIEELLSERPC